MMISVSGYNYTGSSAVIDFLKEYEETSIVKPEIAFVYLPDGIVDLDYHINYSASYFNGDAAIERYWNLCKKSSIPNEYRKEFLNISKAYLTSLEEEKWKGSSSFEGTRKEGVSYGVWYLKKLIKNIIWHFFHKAISINERTMYLAYRNENFYTITRQYLDKLIKIFSNGNKLPVFNQFISAFQPELCLKYFSDGKAIVVDRDPRDIYILGKIKHETSCYPSSDPQKFVKWYKTCWKDCKKENSDNVLYLQFEDLIYNYEETKRTIERFLGISMHVHKKEYFKPEVSINNTQLKHRFPNMKREIEYIENELRDYLYPFTEFEPNTKDFF